MKWSLSRSWTSSLSEAILAAVVSVLVVISIEPPARAQQTHDQEIQRIASSMSDGIRKAGRKKVAVVDFTDLQGDVTELGRYLAEKVSVALFSSAADFEVIDRTHLKAILQEHKLAASGVIDPTTARQLGQIAGVDALVTGTITPIGESVDLSVKVLDTETAKMLGAVTGSIAKTAAITELLEKGLGGSAASVTAAPQADSPRRPVSSPLAQKEVDQDGCLVKLVDCYRSGTGVVFDLTFTRSSDQPSQLRIYLDCDPPFDYCYVVDDLGNQNPVTKIALGATELGCNNRNWGLSTRITTELQPGLPVKARATISNVSVSAQSVSLIVAGNFPRKFVFKDIPIRNKR